jgi:DNA gyrase subunit B
MVQVIEAGHLFIAQPPLFKVKKGRAERYAMSEGELEEFLLANWVERASMKVAGKATPLREESLLELLKQASEFKHLFNKVARRGGGVPGRMLEGFLRGKVGIRKRGITAEKIAQEIQAAVAALGLTSYDVKVRESENGGGGDIDIEGDIPAHVNMEMLKSPDYQILYELYEKVSPLHRGPVVVIDASGKEVTATGPEDVLSKVFEMAKDGATLQRYKGLGEMNPEQLWETTMNPETRTLLRVTMEDAVGADQMFTVLMGDAVEPRRDFIEKNALDVVNLDI